MITHIPGYPRIGPERELKRAVESFWNGSIDAQQLHETAMHLRVSNWKQQHKAGIDLLPCNDFSLYDHVLDTTLLVGAIPERFHALFSDDDNHDSCHPSFLKRYFAMARGFQDDHRDISAMEMTKWFNTNYHYIVPEFTRNQRFSVSSNKITDEFRECRSAGFAAKPVLIGPVSYLLLGKEAGSGFHRLELLPDLLSVYQEILQKLRSLGAEWIQLDEPFLVTDLDQRAREAFLPAYQKLAEARNGLKLMVATYFGGLGDNMERACSLPVDALHVDLVEDPEQLDSILRQFPKDRYLSLGLIDGRNIWKTDLDEAASLIKKAAEKRDTARLMLAPSCSLLHCPVDLDQEDDTRALPEEVKGWMAFSRQKMEELGLLRNVADNTATPGEKELFAKHQQEVYSRRSSGLVHDERVQKRLRELGDRRMQRAHPFAVRKEKQRKELGLPDFFPTTTIGSFPQTKEVRQWRNQLRQGQITAEEYIGKIRSEIKRTIEFQESIGLDLLVHGEFERNDMVEYFGEHLSGFAFTRHGWVQSYGTRCVKPPVIFGDVARPNPITVSWSQYAQSLTRKPVKGMLTGPVTILLWSFVRDDQPPAQTARQLALAIQDEVRDLAEAGIRAIQIDEPAFREGLPLRRSDRDSYLAWAEEAFHIASSCVGDEIQIHTHMCYSDFNNIIDSIARLDADVISIEASRSGMELLEAFRTFNYPNDIGPGVYDIHSPRIPKSPEIIAHLREIIGVIDVAKVWVNPDCGLKTRGWSEVEPALKEMVNAARQMRREVEYLSKTS